jgi:hypothetical protein
VEGACRFAGGGGSDGSRKPSPPLRGRMPEGELRRLVLGIGSTLGIEALVWLTDMGGLSREEAVEVMRSNARTLLRSALKRLREWRIRHRITLWPLVGISLRAKLVFRSTLCRVLGWRQSSLRPVVGVGDVLKPVLSRGPLRTSQLRTAVVQQPCSNPSKYPEMLGKASTWKYDNLQEFCNLQKSPANFHTAFTRQRSLVRTQHRPL